MKQAIDKKVKSKNLIVVERKKSKAIPVDYKKLTLNVDSDSDKAPQEAATGGSLSTSNLENSFATTDPISNDDGAAR